MSIHNELLEKWQQCREKRHPLLVIIKAPLDTLFPCTLIEEFAEITKAKVLNFQDIYQGSLGNSLVISRYSKIQHRAGSQAQCGKPRRPATHGE